MGWVAADFSSARRRGRRDAGEVASLECSALREEEDKSGDWGSGVRDNAFRES